MMSFAKKNPRAFVNNNFELPTLFALLKLLGALFALLACSQIVLLNEDVLEIVKDYAAVSIIS